MKTLSNLKGAVLFLVLAISFASCEKSEIEQENSETTIQQEEGFKSRTGNNDTEIDNFTAEKPIFHMTYKGDLTEEEANAQFKVDADRFIENYKRSHRGVSTEWFYRIVTHTGTQTNNNTNANVWGRVTFQTDKGYKNAGWVKLDNFGNDREKGDWDYYIFRTEYPGQAVSWVEAECASLALQGKDGWFVTHFYAQVYSSIQSISATGYSRIIAQPNVWLDNSTSSGWDYYTNCSDVGRLNF